MTSTRKAKSHIHVGSANSGSNFIASEAVPEAMSLGEVKRATLNDKTLQVVADCIRTYRWHEFLLHEQTDLIAEFIHAAQHGTSTSQ